MHDYLNFRYWAGSDESLQHYLLTIAHAARVTLERQPERDTRDPQATSRLLQLQGNVAVINISGMMNNSDNVYRNMAYQVVGYPEIRDALIQAAVMPEAHKILLNIGSGGGAVTGLHDASALIEKIDASMKPVHAYSDTNMMSAALWLGASARSIHIGPMAEVGSLGVIAVHQEMTRMMENIGVKATVMRAGEFKALGHPMEPLSPEAKAKIQGSLDVMYDKFITHVAAARGVPQEKADAAFGQGREFVGDQALAVGLVDGIRTFDEMVASLQGEIDKKKSASQSGLKFSTGPVVKTALTEAQIAAAVAAGIDLNAGTGEEQVTADKEPTEAEAAAAALAAATATNAGAADNPGAGEGGDPPNTNTEAAQAAVVALLQGQLSAAQAQVVELTVQGTANATKVTALQAAVTGLRAVVEASVSRVRIALNLPVVKVDAMSDTELLAEHTTLTEQFTSKFKAGGIAAVSVKTNENPKGGSDGGEPRRAARIAATRPNKEK